MFLVVRNVGKLAKELPNFRNVPTRESALKI
jgi:hypothetical protein